MFIPLMTENFTFTMNVIDEGVRQHRSQDREEVQTMKRSKCQPPQFYTHTVYSRRHPGSGPAKLQKKKIQTDVPTLRWCAHGVEISQMHVPNSGTCTRGREGESDGKSQGDE
jgi:hypothetical protein